jgi:hypothetical protein
MDRNWMGRVGTNTILVEFRNIKYKINRNKFHISLKNTNFRGFHEILKLKNLGLVVEN